MVAAVIVVGGGIVGVVFAVVVGIAGAVGIVVVLFVCS